MFDRRTDPTDIRLREEQNKKKEMIWDKLTRKSFKEFMKILDRFDPKYIHTSNSTIYRKNRVIADKLTEIIKIAEFKELYQLWEYGDIDKLRDIKLSLI